MTKRQPSGTPVGGQFAPDRKPNSGDLTIATINGAVIAMSRHVNINDDSEVLDAGNMCIHCGRGSGFVNRVPSDRMSEDGIRVSGYMCAECDGCEEDAVFRHCPECDEITAGDDEGICSSCGEKQDEDTSNIPLNIPGSLCTECTGETNFDFDSFASELRAEADAVQIGTKLSSGAKIVKWVNPIEYEDDAAVIQQRLHEDESTDYDPSGWSARGIANILKERNIKTASMTDILDVFDDEDVASIAFDPKRGTHQILMEINETLRGI